MVGQEVVPPGVRITLVGGEQVEPKCLLKRNFIRDASDQTQTLFRFECRLCVVARVNESCASAAERALTPTLSERERGALD